MTFSGVIIGTAISALVLTTILKFTTKRIEYFILSFLQNFCGMFFVFSGLVKAVDPMGTAFKMEQYFAEFEATFEGTAFDFLSGLFPVLATYAIGFSVFMIVLEIVVGIMLVIGARAKLAAWIFILTIIFFTFLTGFTYLTGYVPTTANFFDFSQWGEYIDTNRRVTDCGCFGDFLVIPPKISFLKDVVLLMPAMIFVFKSKDMHKLFSKATRNIIVGASTILMIWYCLSNFVWDIPHVDFRPFREGVNIRDQRNAELDAINNVEIIAWRLKNRETGKIVEISSKVYYSELTGIYSKDKWGVEEMIKTEPTVKASKLSEFAITDADGYDVADEMMDEKGYQFWVVSYKMPYQVTYEKSIQWDTLYRVDTIADTPDEPAQLVKVVEKVEEKSIQIPHYNFDEKYLKGYNSEMAKLITDSKIPAVGFFGGADAVSLGELRNKIDFDLRMYEADDILLKTIVRSNPGLVLMKDGVVVKKWHRENLPSSEELLSLTGTSSNN